MNEPIKVLVVGDTHKGLDPNTIEILEAKLREAQAPNFQIITCPNLADAVKSGGAICVADFSHMENQLLLERIKDENITRKEDTMPDIEQAMATVLALAAATETEPGTGEAAIAQVKEWFDLVTLNFEPEPEYPGVHFGYWGNVVQKGKHGVITLAIVQCPTNPARMQLGVAWCSPKDQFAKNGDKGARSLAFDRAYNDRTNLVFTAPHLPRDIVTAAALAYNAELNKADRIGNKLHRWRDKQLKGGMTVREPAGVPRWAKSIELGADGYLNGVSQH